jgi:hypothetical protein
LWARLRLLFLMCCLCGAQVLLENYSSLNYTGLVKILKKHDKRTGMLLRMPYINNVLRQVRPPSTHPIACLVCMSERGPILYERETDNILGARVLFLYPLSAAEHCCL